MKKIVYLVIAILVALLAVWLILSSVSITLPTYGKVVDSNTQKPIKDAIIFTSESYQEFSPVHSPWEGTNFKIYKTDAEGVFHIPFSVNLVVPLYRTSFHRVGSVMAIGYVTDINDYTPTSHLNFRKTLGVNFLSNKIIALKPILSFEDYKYISATGVSMPQHPEKYREYTSTFQDISKRQKEFAEQKFGPLMGNLLKSEQYRYHANANCEIKTGEDKLICFIERTEEKAVLDGDYKVCSELDSTLQEFVGVSTREGYPPFNSNQIGYFIDRCYGLVAQQTKDKTICEHIKETQSFSGTYLKSECYHSIQE